MRDCHFLCEKFTPVFFLILVGATCLVSDGIAQPKFRVDKQGQRCISDVQPRPMSIGSGVFQHGVSVKNSCRDTISVRVCYVGGSGGCIVVVATGGSTTSGILGSSKSKDFQIEYSEQ
jgi:hypothetical protein